MQTDLHKVLEKISHSSGMVQLNDLTEDEIEEINEFVIYRYQTRFDPNFSVRFGDKLFRPRDRVKGVVVDTDNVVIDYQIKSMMLLAMHVGLREGGDVHKFSTQAFRARIIIKFYKFIYRDYGVDSFFAFCELPSIKTRTMLLDFILSPKSNGGMECSSYPSNAKSTMDALKSLVVFGLANDSFLEALRDVCSPRVKDAESEKIRHGVIPTQVMKRLIGDSVEYLNYSKSKYPELKSIIQAVTIRVRSSRRNKQFRTAGVLTSDKMFQLIDGSFKDVRLHVFTLILAFTGMRNIEALSVRNNSHYKKKVEGEWSYFVRAVLKKTDEGEVELDWVANKEVYDAIEFLSNINQLNHKRAEAILDRYGDKLDQQTFKNYRDGLDDNFLFGSSFNVACGFINPVGASGASPMCLKQHQYRVTQDDIIQLESVGSNSKSVSPVSGMRGKPYKVGDLFNFTAHQFRHTFAWFVIANRLGDLDDIKYQYKHLRRSMALVYSERGYDSLTNLKSIVEYFENILNENAIKDIMDSASKRSIYGGGGQRLASIISRLNNGSSEIFFSDDDQPMFDNIHELSDFVTRYSDGVRGLPHGYCLKGRGCKIKNVSDPSHCLYCETYYVTTKHFVIPPKNDWGFK